MTGVTEALHSAFIDALGAAVLRHSSTGEKPLDVDLKPPHPPLIRVYMYTLVAGGRSRNSEYKIVLRVPGQARGEYGSFDHVEVRFTLVVGYDAGLDVFVLWDASQHFRFKNGGNVQVKEATVMSAAATGRGEQVRMLSSNRAETVLACRSAELPKALTRRLLLTGVANGGF